MTSEWEKALKKENSDEADCHPSLIVVRSELILTHDAILASYLSLISIFWFSF